jgi:hypothetical protein
MKTAIRDEIYTKNSRQKAESFCSDYIHYEGFGATMSELQSASPRLKLGQKVYSYKESKLCHYPPGHFQARKN